MCKCAYAIHVCVHGHIKVKREKNKTKRSKIIIYEHKKIMNEKEQKNAAFKISALKKVISSARCNARNLYIHTSDSIEHISN